MRVGGLLKLRSQSICNGETPLKRLVFTILLHVTWIILNLKPLKEFTWNLILQNITAICCLLKFPLKIDTSNEEFDIFLTVHHSIQLFQITNLTHNSFIL